MGCGVSGLGRMLCWAGVLGVRGAARRCVCLVRLHCAVWWLGLGALRESLGWACGWGAVSACWATSESRCVVGRSSVPGRVLGLFVRD